MELASPFVPHGFPDQPLSGGSQLLRSFLPLQLTAARLQRFSADKFAAQGYASFLLKAVLPALPTHIFPLLLCFV
jgi:hypothetical protein